MDCLVEAAVLGAVGVVVAQVPFAEMAGVVTAGGQDVGHRRQVGAQE